MCVMSMVLDQSRDWMRPYTVPWNPVSPVTQPFPWPTTPPAPGPFFTQEMADFISKLIKGAKDYDTKTGQPDCELEGKKELLRKYADKLKVKIAFE